MKTILLTLLSISLFASPLQADPVVSRVMKEGFKGNSSLVKKASTGQASPQELERLLALLQTLPNGNPPRGNRASFHGKVVHITSLTQRLSSGDTSVLPSFSSATNCKSCHDLHRGASR